MAALLAVALPLLAALAALAAALLLALYLHSTSTFGYWRDRGVRFAPPEPLFGNIREMALLRTSVAEGFQRLYRLFEGERFAGVFQSRAPTLLVRDPLLARQLLAKDFAHFQGRGVPFDARREPLGAHLLYLEGEPWRRMRARLSPAFSPARMRRVFPLVAECAAELERAVDQALPGPGAGPEQAGAELELREPLARFTSDVIGSCVFGMRLDALRDPDCRFRAMGQAVTKPSARPALRRLLRLLLPAAVLRRLPVRAVPRPIAAFFLAATQEAIARRETAARRPDFLQALVDLKQRGRVREESVSEPAAAAVATETDGPPAAPAAEEDDLELTDNALASQAYVFFVAGFETTSAAMSFCLLELAAHPQAQARARAEAAAALDRGSGRLTFEALEDMRYLDSVLMETLRLYPPSANLVRETSAPYRLPGSAVTLDAGVRVLIPVYALHRDPAHWPRPDRFEPERFHSRGHGRRPDAFLPFGDGPRACIGMRFGLLQAKAGLARLLASFDFSVCERTQLPPELDPATLVTRARDGVWLQVARRRLRTPQLPPPLPQ